MTVKDFIEYGGPCLECGQFLSVSLCAGFPTSSNWNYIPVTMQDGKILISLKITYYDTLIMILDPKTNRYAVTGTDEGFAAWLKEHEMYFTKNCKCYSLVQTDSLKFNTEMCFIYPMQVICEVLMAKDHRNMYQLTNLYASPQTNTNQSYSELDITPLTKVNKIGLAPITEPITLPIMPRPRFRDKAHFIDKIRTYLTFS